MAGARVAKRGWTERGVVGLWRWRVWGYGLVEDGWSVVMVGYGFVEVSLWVYGGGECGVVGLWRWLECGGGWLWVCGGGECGVVGLL
nr:hypothetical protein CFP56_56380 [Quercus suber]